MFRRTFLKTIAALAVSITSIGDALGITRRVRKIKSKYAQQVILPILVNKDSGVEYIVYGYHPCGNPKVVNYRLTELDETKFSRINKFSVKAPPEWKYGNSDLSVSPRLDSFFNCDNIDDVNVYFNRNIPVVFTGAIFETPKFGERQPILGANDLKLFDLSCTSNNLPDVPDSIDALSIDEMERMADLTNRPYRNSKERRKAIVDAFAYPKGTNAYDGQPINPS